MNGLQALAGMASQHPKPSTLMALASAETVEVRTRRWIWWLYQTRPVSALEALARSNTR